MRSVRLLPVGVNLEKKTAFLGNSKAWFNFAKTMSAEHGVPVGVLQRCMRGSSGLSRTWFGPDLVTDDPYIQEILDGGNCCESYETVIRQVLRDHGRLSSDAALLGVDTDLYQSGMTSHASVNVMLALEGEFDVEFPDHMLKRNVFSSIASIQRALDELTAA